MTEPGRIPEEALEKMQMKDRVVLVDSEMDDGGWSKPKPFSELFSSCLKAITDLNDEIRSLRIYLEPHLTGEQQRKQYTVGVFETRIPPWKLILNWTPDWKGSRPKQIPPRHIWVEYDDSPVGCIGPYLRERACWACGLHGYDGDPRMGGQPWVVPGQPCPRCFYLDWFGHVDQPGNIIQSTRRIQRADLLEAMASVVAKEADDDQFFGFYEGDRAEILKKTNQASKIV